MFPLCDERGRVLGLRRARAARRTTGPKYLNSSDNAVFHKGEMLYGADLARAAAARAGRVVLVEGYTDAIALRQAGVPEVVGSMGTALTERAGRRAGASSRRAALFCQDPDAAGQEAVPRSIDRAARRQPPPPGRASSSGSCACRPGSDPADVVQRDGADAHAALLERACRSRASRSSARSSGRRHGARTDGRDRALEEAARRDPPLPPSVLREELCSSWPAGWG